MGSREYVWDALGRLSAIREEAKPLAQYRYNHRGERIGKQVQVGGTASNQATQYLYEGGQLSAELNAQGQITRQYVYLADQPIAVIDSAEGKKGIGGQIPIKSLLAIILIAS